MIKAISEPNAQQLVRKTIGKNYFAKLDARTFIGMWAKMTGLKTPCHSNKSSDQRNAPPKR